MEQIFIRQQVCDLLQAAMLKESDLAAAVYRGHRVPVPDREGHFRCTCTVAVPRPWDPETAVLRELQVHLRQSERGLEIYAVDGLETEG